jgi:hypothetical protein
LKDSTAYPAFFIAPAMNPRTVCFCQPIFSMSSVSVAPFFRWSIATTWAVLLPSRGLAVSGALASFLALGAFLAVVVFLVALAFVGAPLAACAPPLAFFVGLRLHLGLGGLAEALDACPDAAHGGLGALEARDSHHAREAVPDGHQALGRPDSGQLRQFLLAGEGIERGGSRSGGLFCGAKRRDVVFAVDGKRRHTRSPWCHALRGHHMDHSEVLETQGESATNHDGKELAMAAYGIRRSLR